MGLSLPSEDVGQERLGVQVSTFLGGVELSVEVEAPSQ